MNKKLGFLLIVFYLLGPTYCDGQTNTPSVSDIQFKSIYGHGKDTTQKYCLLGNIGLRKYTAPDTDSLIANWISKHPKALVIPTAHLKFTSSTFSCWVVDGNDTLNNFLVKKGSFYGDAMIGVLGWGPQFPVSPVSYRKYVTQIRASEQYAIDNKLGIWKDKID